MAVCRSEAFLTREPGCLHRGDLDCWWTEGKQRDFPHAIYISYYIQVLPIQNQTAPALMPPTIFTGDDLIFYLRDLMEQSKDSPQIPTVSKFLANMVPEM